MKKISPFLKTGLWVLTLSIAEPSFADIYSDVAAMAMNSSQMVDLAGEYMPYMEKINATSKAMEALSHEHFDWMEAMESTEWKALTSAYNMGRVIDNAVPTELWSANEWESVLQATSSGNSTRYNQLKTAYASKNPTITSSTSHPTVDIGQLTENTYTQKAAIANTALAASQYVYEDTDNRVNSFDTLKQWMDDPTKNQNEKAAIDLNTRVLIEIGYIQNEMLKLQSIQAQVGAIKAQQEINTDTAEQQFFSNN